jgi:heme-degrading monooxygenase HmoA
MAVKAYLEAIMTINPENRPAAAEVYSTYRQPFLDEIEGALTKELLVRDEDVQVIHGFDSIEHAKAYLESNLFTQKVAPALQKTWAADPDIRIYEVA